MHIYEYLFTAIIIFSILIASSTMIATVSQPSRTVSAKEQLQVAAQKIMTQLTLDPGNPPDWGHYINLTASDLTTFGLAKHGETTREAYVLDQDKVLRLHTTNPLYIEPYDVINLLNLATDYGLRLELYPSLNVTVTNTSGADTYEVSVTTNDIGLPIANANVTARMFYLDSNTSEITGKDPNPSNSITTDFDGKCQFNFGIIPNTQKKILILAVNYYGIRIVTFRSGTDFTPTHLIGNHLFLNQEHNITKNEVSEIIAERTAGGYMIQNVTSKTTQMNSTTYEVDYVEPSAVAVLAVADDGNTLLFASNEATLTYTSVSGFTSSAFAYSLERTVTICGFAYIMRMQIWRMSF